MLLNNRFRILFLSFVVMGLYYPVIFAGINSVDDYSMITEVNELQSVPFRQLFLPGGGLYYRPLLMLTYFADKYLWDMTESFMHLENVLFHLVNTILVFFIAQRVFRASNKLELPLLSGLLFATHPINTEAVAWISGRTDPLASLFVLLSVVSILKGLDENRRAYLYLSPLFLLLGCMSKEVAVFFLPAACMIAVMWQPLQSSKGQGLYQLFLSKWRPALIITGPFAVAGLLYLGLRGWSVGNGISVLKGGGYDALNMARIVLKVFGFYVKKLFLPLPLNFAITSVHNGYVAMGLASFLFLMILLLYRRDGVSIFLATAFFLITPAVLVALNHFTWTPVAERYLYLPSAFFSIAVVGACAEIFTRIKRDHFAIPLAAMVLIPAAFFTAQRNIVWQDNVSLYEDTLRKSPGFVSIRNELAIALMNHGKSADADVQLETAKKLDPQKTNVLLYVNQAKLKLQNGDTSAARRILLETFSEKREANPEVLKMLAKVDEKRLFTAKTKTEGRAIHRQLLDTYDHLYGKTQNPVNLYRCGQLSLFLDDKKKAGEYFQRAYDVSPEGAFFKPAAKKLAEKLKQ